MANTIHQKIESASHIHMVGIKGVGMSALAQILISQGKKVTGSDIEEEFVTDHVLHEAGIEVVRFSRSNIDTSVDLVVSSSAYSADSNEDLEAAREEEKELLYYDDVLASLFNMKEGIAVTGSHGKSTTAALVAHVLEQCGRDPGALIGAEVVQWNSNARISNSSIMVVEADEYQGKFAKLIPHFVIITNIDWDHPDYYKTREEYEQVYIDYVKSLPASSFVLLNRQDQTTVETLGGMTSESILWYSDVKIDDVPLIGGGIQSSVGAVITLAEKMNLDIDQVERAIQSFKGIRRRGELIFESEALKIYDDYAHHPTEISAVLSAFRERFSSEKLIVLFQAHTVTRTEAFLQDFGSSFNLADEIVVIPTYFSAREGGDSSDIDAKLFEMIKKSKGDGVRLSTDFDDAEKIVLELSQNGGVVVTMGAGDVRDIAISLRDKQ